MDKKIGLKLKHVNNAIRRYIDNYSHKKELDRVTGTNGWIIGFLMENEGRDVYQKELEEHFGVTRSTASKVVNLMVQKGLVERQMVAHDARLRKLVLTPEARKYAQIMREDHREMERRLLSGFSPEEVEKLADYLERILRNIDVR